MQICYLCYHNNIRAAAVSVHRNDEVCFIIHCILVNIIVNTYVNFVVVL